MTWNANNFWCKSCLKNKNRPRVLWGRQPILPLCVRSTRSDWLVWNYPRHRSPQPAFLSNVCNLGKKVSHFSFDWAKCWRRSCWAVRDETGAFQSGKVKSIFLSALFLQSESYSGDIRLMAGAAGLFPADRPLLSMPTMSTGSDYCLRDPDNVCHWSGHLSWTPAASACFQRPRGDKQIHISR